MIASALVIGGVPYVRTSNQTSLHTVDALNRAGVHVTYVCRRTHQRSVKKLLGMNPMAAGVLSWTVDHVHDLLTVLWAPSLFDAVPMAHPEFLRRIATHSLAKSLLRLESQNGRQFDTVIAYWWFVPEAVSAVGAGERVLDVIDRHWDPAVNGGHVKRAGKQKDVLLRTAKVCHRVVTVSEGIASELGTEIPHVHVLPNGIDTSRLDQRRRQPHRRKVVAYVGGLNSRFDTSIFNSLAAANQDWLFLVAGSGPASLDIEPANNVYLLGNLDYQHVQEVLGRARYGVVPFKDSPYLSASNLLKVLDYLGAGLRILVTPSVQLGSVADEGAPVVKIVSGDHMSKCLEQDKDEMRPGLKTDMSPYSTDHRVQNLLGGQL